LQPPRPTARRPAGATRRRHPPFPRRAIGPRRHTGRGNPIQRYRPRPPMRDDAFADRHCSPQGPDPAPPGQIGWRCARCHSWAGPCRPGP
jgi:hypothetical protein